MNHMLRMVHDNEVTKICLAIRNKQLRRGVVISHEVGEKVNINVFVVPMTPPPEVGLGIDMITNDPGEWPTDPDDPTDLEIL